MNQLPSIETIITGAIKLDHYLKGRGVDFTYWKTIVVMQEQIPKVQLTEEQQEYIKLYPVELNPATWAQCEALARKMTGNPFLSEQQATIVIKYLFITRVTGEGIPSPENAPRAVAELKDQLDAMGSSKRRR